MRTAPAPVSMGLLGQLDPRVKIAAVILIGLAALAAGPPALALASAAAAGLLAWSRIPLRLSGAQLRWLGSLLALVVIARTVATPGAPLGRLGPFVLSGPGLYHGMLVCWRLLLVVLLGLLLTATTPPTAVKAAVQWALKPIPWIPERRVAVMMGLMLRFMPLLFQQARETGDAQRARCIELRRQPFERMTRFGLCLLRDTFHKADRLALGMAARCYSDRRTDPPLSFTRRDRGAAAALALLLAAMILLDRFTPSGAILPKAAGALF